MTIIDIHNAAYKFCSHCCKSAPNAHVTILKSGTKAWARIVVRRDIDIQLYLTVFEVLASTFIFIGNSQYPLPRLARMNSPTINGLFSSELQPGNVMGIGEDATQGESSKEDYEKDYEESKKCGFIYLNLGLQYVVISNFNNF